MIDKVDIKKLEKEIGDKINVRCQQNRIEKAKKRNQFIDDVIQLGMHNRVKETSPNQFKIDNSYMFYPITNKWQAPSRGKVYRCCGFKDFHERFLHRFHKKKVTLTETQYKIYQWFKCGYGFFTFKKIARDTNLTYGAVYYAVSKLVEKGVITTRMTLYQRENLYFLSDSVEVLCADSTSVKYNSKPTPVADSNNLKHQIYLSAKKYGIKQKDVAEKLNVSPAYVSQVLTGINGVVETSLKSGPKNNNKTLDMNIKKTVNETIKIIPITDLLKAQPDNLFKRVLKRFRREA